MLTLRNRCTIAGAFFLAAVLLLAAPASTRAAYPDKPIKLVSPLPPGGSNDIFARLLAEKMSATLGVNTFVENRAQSAGFLAASYVAGAAPDGYTMLAASPTVLIVEPSRNKDVPYRPREDFAPVRFLMKWNLMLATSPASGISSLKGLMDLMRSSPEKVSYGTAGLATPAHIAAERLAQIAGAKPTAIHLRGANPAMVETMTGRITYTFQSIAALDPLVKAGKLLALAVPIARRSTVVPQVPTMAEAGLPEFMSVDWSTWNVLLAPVKTPADIVERMHNALGQMLGDPALRKRMGELGFEAMEDMSHQETIAFFNAQFDRWGPFLKQIDLNR